MIELRFFWSLFIGVSVLIQAADAEDWPQYRGPMANGQATETLEIKNGKLKVHWKIDTPLGFSSFVVSDGIAVTIVGRQEKEVCVAFRAKDGTEIWSQAMGSTDYEHGGGGAGAQGNKGGDGPRSTPAISNGKVFVYDAHLVLHCFRLSDGQPIWRHDIAEEFDGRNVKWKNATSPLIDEDTVYIAGGGQGASFLAFEQESGELKWKNGDEMLTHASPVFANTDSDRQIVFFMQFGLIAVNAATGNEVWRSKFPFDVSTAASPVINGQQIYCSAGYGVGAGMYDVTNTANIQEVWRMPNRLINHWSSPVLHESHLFGLYKFKRFGKAPLQCVEFATGKIKWTETGYGQGNCILAGDKIVVLSDYGDLAIVEANPTEYNELFRQKVLDGKCWSTPAYADGKIYIRSTKQAACVSFE